jgi:hypothetical protein
MCPHDKFDVLYYRDDIMIRRCNYCERIEIRVESWADPTEVVRVINLIVTKGE